MTTLFTTTKKLIIAVALILVSSSAFSQFVLDAVFRPRAEFRNGYKTLAPDTADPGFAVSQRTRFNIGYKRDKMSLFISFQDVRTWGDVKQLNSSDYNGTTIHQAWGQYQISKTLAIKVGRQELVYDNHRFFGNVEWAQQARSHDVAVFKFVKKKLKIDLGLAFNQAEPTNTSTVYTLTPSNYKTMQYVWAHNDWENLGVSFYFVNNGMQFIDVPNNIYATRFSQTIGTYAVKKHKNLSFAGTFYYQTGKDIDANSLAAYLIGLDVKWAKADKKWSAGAGFEIQSGNDLNWKSSSDSTTNKAFNPMYGTNHKFNGFMDYFYVGGSHFNSVGLVDVNASIGYKLKKSKLKLTVHNFMSSGSMVVNTPTGLETRSSQLGTEVDIVWNIALGDDANLKIGYSQMFAGESMELIKPTGSYGNLNNWAWAMLSFTPQLFKHEYKKPTSTSVETVK